MESYPTWPNLAAMMFDLAKKWPHKPLFRAYRDNAWHGTDMGGIRPDDGVMRPPPSRPGQSRRATGW